MIEFKKEGPTFARDLFEAYVKSIGNFTNICSLSHMDEPWIGSIVDLVCAQLVKYADDADIEAQVNPPKTEDIDELEEFHFTKKAQQRLTSLYNAC